jgi:hypothetical protein
MHASHHVECELKLSAASAQEASDAMALIADRLAIDPIKRQKPASATYFDVGQLLLDNERSFRAMRAEDRFAYVYKIPVRSATQATVRQEIRIEAKAPLDLADPFLLGSPALVDLGDLVHNAGQRPEDFAPALIVIQQRDVYAFHDAENRVPFVGIVSLDEVSARPAIGRETVIFHQIEIELTKVYPSALATLEDIAASMERSGHLPTRKCKYAQARTLLCATT